MPLAAKGKECYTEEEPPDRGGERKGHAMPKARILVVEDDADINRLLAAILTREEYAVTQAYSGSEAAMRLELDAYDLLLLDLMLPGLTGEELITLVRQSHTMPIIVISAKGQEDKLHVLKLGADDFISKPFDVEEILARVEAQLRRYMRFSSPAPDNKILRFKNLELDTEGIRVTVHGQPVTLTAREFGILELLMTYPHKVFTRENLFETVWQDAYMGDDTTITVHISNIRSYIARADPDNEYIKTVWGIGFKMQD